MRQGHLRFERCELRVVVKGSAFINVLFWVLCGSTMMQMAGKSHVEWWNDRGIEGWQPAGKLRHTQNVRLFSFKN